MATQNILPTAIVSKADVMRLTKELEGLNEELHQAGVRRGGATNTVPKATTMLEEVAAETNTNLLQADERDKLLAMLRDLSSQAPVVHISFAVTPSPSFLQKIVSWFRREVNPNTLLQVGLQPSIAAGCVMRTPNKYFDFSLRRAIAGKQDLLIEKLRGATSEQQK